MRDRRYSRIVSGIFTSKKITKCFIRSPKSVVPLPAESHAKMMLMLYIYQQTKKIASLTNLIKPPLFYVALDFTGEHFNMLLIVGLKCGP